MLPSHLRRFLPHLAMTAMIAIWGGSYAVVKQALASLSPLAVITLRFWLAILCLLPFVRADIWKQLRQARGPGLAAGAVLAIGYLGQTYGMQGTSASMGGFLAGLIVPLVALGGWMLFGGRFGRAAVVGLLLGCLGIALLCWPNEEVVGQPDTPLGIGLQLAASLSYAAHILLISRYGNNAPTLAFCLWQLLVVAVAGTLALLGNSGLAATAGGEVAWTPALLALVAYLGVLATAVGIGVQSMVQHRIPSMHLALLFALQPLFAAVTGWLTLDEQLGNMQLLGGACVIGGVLITSLDR
jgi:drug/metabolite transporter (DMT)-like permease